MEQNEKAYEEVKQSPCIRELAMQNGLSFPSDRELLMLILGSGTREVPVESLARRSLEVIRESPPGDLVARLGCITGMGRSKALAVAAALELGRRMSGCLRAVVNRPSEIIPYVKHYAMECREHFVCVSLNGAHEIMAIRVVSIGSTSRAFTERFLWRSLAMSTRLLFTDGSPGQGICGSRTASSPRCSTLIGRLCRRSILR